MTPLETFLRACAAFVVVSSGGYAETKTTDAFTLNRAFSRAVQGGDVSEAKRLIEAGADVNTHEINGGFALQDAINLAQSAMTKFLLEHGANVNQADDFGETALIAAVKNQRTEWISPLLIQGANVHAHRDEALALAVDAENESIVATLLAAGADPNAIDNEGKSIAMRAVRGSTPILKAVLNAGAKLDVRAVDAHGHTLAMYAASRANLDTLRVLAAQGADLKAIDADGNTLLQQLPLTWLGDDSENVAEMVRWLLKQGLNVNATNVRGETALLQASGQWMSEAGGSLAHISVVRALLDAGADAKQRDAEGNTALHRIIRGGPENAEIVRLLVDHGVGLDATNAEGRTALMLACARGAVDTVRTLLKAGANPAVASSDGTTALSLARAGRLRQSGGSESAERFDTVIASLENVPPPEGVSHSP